MFKLLGHALGHSFGLVVMVLANTLAVTLGGPVGFLHIVNILYTTGYLLVPFGYLFNVLSEGRTKRKQLKVNMNSPEFLKEFEYKASLKTQKKLDKLAIKEAKRGK